MSQTKTPNGGSALALTNQQILALSEAIAHLDGHTVTQIMDGKPVAVFKSYRLAHTARWRMAQAQGKLQVAIADFNRAKDALIKHHANGQSAINPTMPAFAPFLEDVEKLKLQTVDLPLDSISLDQLKLEENEIAGSEFPIAVLNALAPLIKN